MRSPLALITNSMEEKGVLRDQTFRVLGGSRRFGGKCFQITSTLVGGRSTERARSSSRQVERGRFRPRPTSSSRSSLLASRFCRSAALLVALSYTDYALTLIRTPRIAYLHMYSRGSWGSRAA